MKRGRLIVALLLCAGLIGGLAATAGAQQTTPPTLPLSLIKLNREDTFKFIDNPPRQGVRRPPSHGDAGVLRSKLRNRARQRVGTLLAEFTFLGRRSSLVHGVFKLRNGQITAEGFIGGGRRDVVAITGGTGLYEGAQGTLTVITRRATSTFRFHFTA